MMEHLVIQGITFNGCCGITSQERQTPQPIQVDLEISGDFQAAILADDIGKTIDYAEVTTAIVALGTTQKFALIESLADALIHKLFDQFPFHSLNIWARKIHPPLSHLEGSVGVRMSRTRKNLGFKNSPPAPFLLDQLHRLEKGHTLDVATRTGRNAIFLASQGFTVEGIDRDTTALEELQSAIDTRHLPHLTTRSLDLEPPTGREVDLGAEKYDLILVFFYLYRPLFPALLRALKPGGKLLYETFLIDNHRYHNHPRRKEFCLNPNELLHLSQGLQVLHYDEGPHMDPQTGESTFTARLLAQQPLTRSHHVPR